MTHSTCFVRVEPIKVPGNDWHRYGECQYAGNGARRTNQLADVANGHFVAVADRRHGNDRPPERVRDAVDLRVWLSELGVVDEAGEYEKADEQSHQEHAETFQTRGRWLVETVQTSKISWEFPLLTKIFRDLPDWRGTSAEGPEVRRSAW